MCMDVGPDPIPRVGGCGCSGEATWVPNPGLDPVAEWMESLES